jgi:hypothetical protein
MVGDELQLEKAFAERDAEAALAHTQAVRDEAEYELLTFDERQTHGTMPDLFDEPAQVVDAEKPPGIADRSAELMQQMAESDAKLFRTSGEFLSKAVEIPTTAYRKITAKTGQDRVQSAAESLVGWSTTPGSTPISMDEAMQLVRAKGAILDPDAIPGLDMGIAREQRSMGRATPEVQAAYESFYGLRKPEHLKVVETAAVGQKQAIDNQMNQIRNQASKEGC